MPFNAEGGPFIPPNCPVIRVGDVPDLRATSLELQVTDQSTFGLGIEVMCAMGVTPPEPFGIIETGVVYEPSDTEWARKVQRLAAAEGTKPTPDWTIVRSKTSPVAEAVRQKLCERVSICRGVVDGECWALGHGAVKEVIGEVLSKEPPASP